MRVVLDLPLPPMRRYFVPARESVVIGKAGKAYRALVGTAVRDAGLRRPMVGPVKVEMRVRPLGPREGELPDLLKNLFDGLRRGGVYGADCQITRLVAEVDEPEEGEADVRVTVTDRHALPPELFTRKAEAGQ